MNVNNSLTLRCHVSRCCYPEKKKKEINIYLPEKLTVSVSFFDVWRVEILPDAVLLFKTVCDLKIKTESYSSVEHDLTN